MYIKIMAKLLIVTARYYQDISNALEQGATEALEQAGALYDIVEVPGALEIPAAIAMAAPSNQYDGYVALGSIIRGETSHYDIVAGESARGLNDLAIHQHLPIGNGVLTTENKAQAEARADITRGNKGGFAAKAALRMTALKSNWKA